MHASILRFWRWVVFGAENIFRMFLFFVRHGLRRLIRMLFCDERHNRHLLLVAEAVSNCGSWHIAVRLACRRGLAFRRCFCNLYDIPRKLPFRALPSMKSPSGFRDSKEMASTYRACDICHNSEYVPRLRTARHECQHGIRYRWSGRT